MSDVGVLTKNVDVRDSKQVTELITHTHSKTGRIDILFNNADITFGSRLENATEDRFEDHIAGHLFGCIYGMRAAIPAMLSQAYRRIINTISRNAEFDMPGTSAYGAAKSAIWSVSRVSAREVSDSDILITTPIPGPTNTGIGERST